MAGYETECLSEYVYKNAGKLVFARADHQHSRELFDFSEEELGKPYMETLVWIKQTLLDLESFVDAMQQLEGLLNTRRSAIEKKTSADAKLAKLRTRPDKDKEVAALEAELVGLYKDVENWTAISNITVTYMTELFLPDFKRKQIMLFYKVIERLFNSHIGQYERLKEAWDLVLADKNLQHF
jgi:hypothetical protein